MTHNGQWRSLKLRQGLSVANLEKVSLVDLIHGAGYEFFAKGEDDATRRAIFLEALTLRLHIRRLIRQKLDSVERTALIRFCWQARENFVELSFGFSDAGFELDHCVGPQFLL